MMNVDDDSNNQVQPTYLFMDAWFARAGMSSWCISRPGRCRRWSNGVVDSNISPCSLAWTAAACRPSLTSPSVTTHGIISSLIVVCVRVTALGRWWPPITLYCHPACINISVRSKLLYIIFIMRSYTRYAQTQANNNDDNNNKQGDHSADTLKFPDISLTMCGTHAKWYS